MLRIKAGAVRLHDLKLLQSFQQIRCGRGGEGRGDKKNLPTTNTKLVNNYKTFAQRGMYKVIIILHTTYRAISAKQTLWVHLCFTEQVAMLPFRCWQAREPVPQPSGTPSAHTDAGNIMHKDLHG